MNTRFPLHLALSAISNPPDNANNPTTPTNPADFIPSLSLAQYAFLKELLSYYPEATFLEITEEVNSLRLLTEAELATPQQQELQQQDNEFFGMTVFIGNQQYQVETKVYSWSPYERIQQSNHPQVRNILIYSPLLFNSISFFF